MTMTVAMYRRDHEQPENQHVKFNVDIKVQNEPNQIFALMNKIITSYPEWEVRLAPRIILGLWHPRFIGPAKTHLPYCRRSHIGSVPDIARQYFWNDCDAFSMWFPGLVTVDGEKSELSAIRTNSNFLTIFASDSGGSARRLGNKSWYGQ
jgi:hypothetical protein